jgi:two-component system, LuxR family, sensor kinase FixL
MSLLRHITDRGSRRFGNAARLPLCGFVAVCLLLLTNGFCATGAEPKRVLVVHSFGTVAPPFTTHSTAFEAELVKRMGNHVDLDEVSLDMARYDAPDMQEAVVDYLEKRGAKWKPDLVVPIGGPAGIFVAKFRHRLFPNIPILYCSLDRRLLGPDSFDENTTFVGANYEVRGFAEDILQIAPDTKNIAIVIGATPLEQYWTEAFRKGFEPFTDRVNFIWFNDLSFDQMLERVQTLPPHSFIFLILFLRDAAGVTQNADEALQRLRAVANAPINSIFTSQMGLGIVGGRLYPSTEDGMKAADIAVQILNGAPPSSFPPRIVPPSSPHYDWRELRRWKIDERHLPPGSTILFRSPTIWEQYRWWFIAGASVCVLQALLIAGLVANLIRRRRAEGSLVESERRFQVMADATPVLIWMAGPDKLCTFFNQAWLDFTGRTMEQECGNGWSEGVHPDDLEKCLKQYVASLDARQPFLMQYRLRRKDGEYRSVTNSGVPRYDAAGGFLGYVGACVDVTELEEKERALHDFEERVTLAAEAAHLGVWELDTKTKDLWISDSARKLFHFEPGERVSYQSFTDRIHPEDRPKPEAALQRAIETDGGCDMEFRVLLPNGTIRWISGRARCMFRGAGKSARLVGVSMDVTERKQAELEAKQRRDELSHLSRVALVGELSASIAHELNQPLAGILTNAGAGECLIDRGDVDQKEIGELLADISADARRASDVVHGIRGMIKKEQVTRRRINLNDVVTNVVQIIGSDALLHACELKTSLEAALPIVEVDPVQIQQVLINLIVNAFDAMRDTPVSKRRVEIMTRENGDGSVRISVRDYGVGISDETRSRIFEQFFTTKPEGLGMGLAIVRSIIEAHAGTIEAENAEGEGARFHFTLPISAVG